MAPVMKKPCVMWNRNTAQSMMGTLARAAHRVKRPRIIRTPPIRCAPIRYHTPTEANGSPMALVMKAAARAGPRTTSAWYPCIR